MKSLYLYFRIRIFPFFLTDEIPDLPSSTTKEFSFFFFTSIVDNLVLGIKFVIFSVLQTIAY